MRLHILVAILFTYFIFQCILSLDPADPTHYVVAEKQYGYNFVEVKKNLEEERFVMFKKIIPPMQHARGIVHA